MSLCNEFRTPLLCCGAEYREKIFSVSKADKIEVQETFLPSAEMYEYSQHVDSLALKGETTRGAFISPEEVCLLIGRRRPFQQYKDRKRKFSIIILPEKEYNKLKSSSKDGYRPYFEDDIRPASLPKEVERILRGLTFSLAEKVKIALAFEKE